MLRCGNGAKAEVIKVMAAVQELRDKFQELSETEARVAIPLHPPHS